MKKYTNILSVIYYIIFIPLCVYLRFLNDSIQTHSDGVSVFLKNSASVITMALPVVIFLTLAISYILKKEDNRLIPAIILSIPLVLFALLGIIIGVA